MKAREDMAFEAYSSSAAVRSSPAASMRAARSGAIGQRIADLGELAKVRISSLVLVVTAVGFCLGSPSGVDYVVLLHTLLGVFLVAAAANTLNQLMERRYDRLMPRTMDRPIAAGRVSPREALVWGGAAAVLGLLYLGITTNLPATLLAGATIVLYLAVYTPLKRVTAQNTLAGSVPGALPPLIGYAAACGTLDVTALLLFTILFLWQPPHFFAIAWMYREDYRLGGYRMISTVDPSGAAIKRQTPVYVGLLAGASLLPVVLGMAGGSYLAGAAVLNAGLAATALHMSSRLSDRSARRMLLASVVYLPLLLMLLVLCR